MPKAAAKPKPARRLSDPCDPVACSDLRSKLEYCCGVLLLHGLIDGDTAARVQREIGERAEREAAA